MKKIVFLLSCICLTAAVQAAIKTQAERDKTYNFSSVRTWAWDPKGAGDVFVARTAEDDPVKIKARVDPWIREAVEAEMRIRGLTVANETPDIHVHYYALITIGSNAQVMGQFLPPVTEFGVPPFVAATTSLKVVTRGSLVLDAMVPADRQIVWRGIAEADLKEGVPDQVRAKRVREATYELVKRLPVKKPK
jgi:Domain of unknown function (DUF4136)